MFNCLSSHYLRHIAASRAHQSNMVSSAARPAQVLHEEAPPRSEKCAGMRVAGEESGFGGGAWMWFAGTSEGQFSTSASEFVLVTAAVGWLGSLRPL